MRKAQRLTRAQVIRRLRAHAAAHGAVTNASLSKHDKTLHRSIPLHFVGIEAARVAAGVPGPTFVKRRAKTGPKPGTKPPNVGVIHWTEQRIVDELRRLANTGMAMQSGVLIAAGHGTLVRSAQERLGGLEQARKKAGIAKPARTQVKKSTWSREGIIDALQEHARNGGSFETSRIRYPFYSAARRLFGNWPNALAAAGVSPSTLRKPTKHTREAIIAKLRSAAQSGADLRAASIAKLINLRAMTREFGSFNNALRAAGIDEHLVKLAHGGARWTRERVIEVLRNCSASSDASTPPALQRAMIKYFGGVTEARRAAGLE